MFGAPAATSRDDEMFGAPQDVAPVPSAGAVDDSPLGGPTLTDGEMGSILDDADTRFTIGGKLYLRLDAAVPDINEPMLADVSLANPNLYELYADARPTDRLRAYSRVRLRHDLSLEDGDVDAFTGLEEEPTSVTLDQLWLNFDVGRRVYVTAGRQRIKWGAGRFWNPTDFLAPARLDSLAFFDERTGVGLVKVHLPFDFLSSNLYVVADIEGAQAADQVGGAVRYEAVAGLTEVALSAANRKSGPLQLGGQLTTGLGLVDLRGEVALTHGDTQPYWEGTLDLETFTFPTEVSREDDWIVQAVVGAEVGFRLGDNDTLFLGVEGFYNDAGTDDPDIYPWLLLQEQFQPFYLGRQYAGAYVFLPGPGTGRWDDLSWTGSLLGNLSDSSAVTRFDFSARVLTRMNLNVYTAWHFGESGEFHWSLDIPPVVGVLDDGLQVDAPRFDTGVGLSLDF
jgi:hypothetical protein